MEEVIISLVKNFGNLGPMFGFFLIYIESMIPILPLAVFITLNVAAFGSFMGFIISYIATVFGCISMFFICRKLSSFFYKKFKHNKKINSYRKKIDNISFPNLVLITSIPFMPAFAVNIAAGLSDIDSKKFISSIIISKIVMVYFWAFIGKSLSDSLTDIYTILQICVMLILALLVSKIANKFLRY